MIKHSNFWTKEKYRKSKKTFNTEVPCLVMIICWCVNAHKITPVTHHKETGNDPDDMVLSGPEISCKQA
jgi:hypothetical protein